VRLLLDTCTFLWLIGQSEGLSAEARRLLADPELPCFLSVASLWEIIVKFHAGKLEIEPRGQSVERFLSEQRNAHSIGHLPLDEPELAHLPVLPPLHRDPFDRILICQAIEHGLTILTPDPAIRRYPVKTLW
jgi:PIN domain nuclease of toxin-antitoxin system